MAAFQRWIAYARHWLMYTAAFGFVPYGAGQTDSYSAIMEGTFRREIMEGTFHGGSIRILKAAMGRFAYDSEGILTLELAAQSSLLAGQINTGYLTAALAPSGNPLRLASAG